MDLVSSTLDKYLKHRFNGSAMSTDAKIGTVKINGEIKSDTASTINGTGETLPNNTQPKSEAIEEPDSPSTIYHIHTSDLRPCCCDMSEDSRFFAMGFENSQIHLHEFSGDKSTNSTNDKNGTQAESRDLGDNLPNRLASEIIHSHATNETSDPLRIVETSKLLAHYGPVYSIKFVQNNDLMLSCSEDTTIRLWCLNTKCNLIIYRGHIYPVWSLSIGPTREYFASASMDATARLWRFDKITPLRIFCGHDGDVECVGFHPNSKYIATGSSDTTVRLWSISDAKIVRLMIGHKDTVSSLSFLPNGKYLASADAAGNIKIWNIAENNTISDISVPTPQTISFSPVQNFISTCGRDNILQIWKINKSNITESRRFELSERRHTLFISSVFLRDKLFVISFKDEEAHTVEVRMLTDTDM